MARNTKPPRNGAGVDFDRPHPLERLIEEVSLDSFEDDLGAREDAWAHKVRRQLDAKLASLRRQHHPGRPVEHRVSRVSAELLAMDRPALLARLAALESAPGVQIAHLSLSSLTNDDLRLLVAELEAAAPTQEVQS